MEVSMAHWESLSREEQMMQATAAQERYSSTLMRKANVTGTAVGLIKRGGAHTGEVGLVVLVEKKVPESQLAPQDIVPHEIDGVPVDVQEIGTILAQ
jgi:hypothetical protein